MVSVEDFISKHNYNLNAKYYIEKQINAALFRLFSTFEINIEVQLKKMISYYFIRNGMKKYPKDFAKPIFYQMIIE